MKATKKIVGAACALIAAVALSAGSTFAWFSSNSNVSISQISATVVTKGGDLQIAPVSIADGTGVPGAYSYKLTADEFNGKLDAVTTADGFNFKVPKEWNDDGSVKQYANCSVNEAKDSTASDVVYRLTFSLRSTTPMNIYFNNDTALTSAASTSQPTAAQVKAWDDTVTVANYGKAVAKGNMLETTAANAARVSFVLWSAADEPTTSAVGNNVFWAPHDSADGSVTDGFYKGNLAADYITQNKTGSVDDPAEAYYLPTGATKVAKVLAAKDKAETGKEFITLAAGTDTIITLFLWIEGQDGDCLNYIFDQTVKLDISFYGVDTSGASGGGSSGESSGS